MSEKIKALVDQRGKALNRARQILDLAGNRALTAEENANYDSAFAEAQNLKNRIDSEAKLNEAEKEAATPVNSNVARLESGNPGAPSDKSNPVMNAFRSFLITGALPNTAEIRNELRADIDSQGGALTAPQEFVSDLIKAVDNEVFIRQLATVYKLTSSDTLGQPSLDADPDDAEWTSEVGTVSEDSTMAFGKRELKTSPLAKLVRVSQKLLRLSPNAERVVLERLAYKFSITQEKGFLTGSGANQALGLFTASTNGVTTSRDVSTDNTITAVTADGLINAKYSLKGGYLRNARWIGHRDFYKQVAKLKDGDGQYIWRGNLQAGEPDILLNLPVHMSEYAPNTFTTGQYVAVLGDLSYYHIADSLLVTIQRLNELYAATNKVGFIGRAEVDGMPVLAEAFARVKLA